MIINKLSLKLYLITYILLVAACTHVKEYWPAEIPSKSTFISFYKQDKENLAKQTQEEYLLWIQRFYLGWEIYRRGWVKMTNELLDEIDSPQEKQRIKHKMNKLGFAISSEWAKKTKHRRIYTRHVSVWGNALLESLNRGEYEQLIDKVQQDVNDLLSHKLEPKSISASRYYPEDENNPFLD